MPTGRVRNWTGSIGQIVDTNGVQYTFDRNDLAGLPAEEVANGVTVEFDSAKAGSSWQARYVRRVGEPSPAKPRTAPVPIPEIDRTAFGDGIEGIPELLDLTPVPLARETLGMVPVPRLLQHLLESVPVRDRHPGLQLDKFLLPVRDQESQRRVLEEIASIPPNTTLFAELRGRHQDRLDALKADSWARTTSTPLTLHLARASALEDAGICLHPVHGFMYLPGTGLKGLARAYAEQVWLPAHPNEAPRIVEVFGNVRGEPKPENQRAGAVVFHDAWPEKWPRLVVDLANNHHAKYYQGDAPPGDWHDPVPTYFLAVPAGVTFTFALSLRRPEEKLDDLLTLARRWLDGALTFRGAGAKTNAGYGCFAQPATPLVLASPRFDSFEATLTLTTPAYLAGAMQRSDDCDLRAATLRGLLRWWWRTLHAGYVDVPTLRRMEALLWGDTEAGGALQLRVEKVPGDLRPHESPYKDVHPSNNRTRFNNLFRQQHGIWEAPQGRTQGLVYAGHGLDEGEPPNRRRRWVAPAGMAWRVSLIAEERGPLKAADILKQGKAALWWWAFLGGAGARSRKGFGSFNDPTEMKTFEGGRWLSLGKEFRTAFGLPESAFNPAFAESPSIHLMRELAKSLNQNPWLEVGTVWSDPWRVLDELGMAMQVFAQASPRTGHGSHCDRKRYLGLPRMLHGPNRKPMNHQDAKTHKPQEDIRGHHGERHASPIFYHVAGVPGQRLTIRVAAFPTASLRPRGMDAVSGLRECTELHRELLTELAGYLATRANVS